MTSPDLLERQFTLRTAVVRYDELRVRDALAAGPDRRSTPSSAQDPDGDLGGPPLTREEALEMLALGELISRKAGYGRQLGVRSGRAAGASWSQIGEAVGISKQSAWETHLRWLDEQAAAATDW